MSTSLTSGEGREGGDSPPTQSAVPTIPTATPSENPYLKALNEREIAPAVVSRRPSAVSRANSTRTSSNTERLVSFRALRRDYGIEPRISTSQVPATPFDLLGLSSFEGPPNIETPRPPSISFPITPTFDLPRISSIDYPSINDHSIDLHSVDLPGTPLSSLPALNFPSREPFNLESPNSDHPGVEPPSVDLSGLVGPVSLQEPGLVDSGLPLPVLPAQPTQNVVHPESQIPSGMVTQLADGTFRIKTRCRCKHVFENIIHSNDIHVAEAFFRLMDRYDPNSPCLKESSGWEIDYRFGIEQLELSRSSNRDGSGSRARAWFNQQHQERSMDPDPEPGLDPGDVNMTPIPSERGTSPSQSAGSEPQKPPGVLRDRLRHSFICLAIGRPTEWRLCHVDFPVDEEGRQYGGTSQGEIFKRILSTFQSQIRKRFFRQLILPLKLSHIEYWEMCLFDNRLMAVSLYGKERLPDEGGPGWQTRCAENMWTFTSAQEVPDIKYHLSSDRLTHYIEHSSHIANDLNYWAWIPRRLNSELRRNDGDPHALGWGLVAYVELNYVIFLAIWGQIAFYLSLSLCLGLSIPKKAPLHGNPGAAIAVFIAPFTLLGIIYGLVYNYAKHKSIFT